MEHFMKHAVTLAQKGMWHTAPNPCVGAVLVWKDTIIAEGYHSAYGKPHAEVECLLDAMSKGVFSGSQCAFTDPLLAGKYEESQHITPDNALQGVTLQECVLYCTLEPCHHRGQTPPCTAAIIESGILCVKIACIDPNPVASGGITALKNADIRVETGIYEVESAKLLEDFITWQTKKRPYVILKMSMSLDGRIGTRDGHSERISGDESRAILMALRENIGIAGGAIMVGSNTFLLDNPKLTARTDTAQKQPLAVIISSKVPSEKHFSGELFYCMHERAHETLIFSSNAQAASPYAYELRKKGLRITGVSQDTKERGLNCDEILHSLYEDYHCPYVLCEGGAYLGGSLLKAGLVDELILHIAPIIFGDGEAKPVFNGLSIGQMEDVLRMKIQKCMMVGSDCHIHLKSE